MGRCGAAKQRGFRNWRSAKQLELSTQTWDPGMAALTLTFQTPRKSRVPHRSQPSWHKELFSMATKQIVEHLLWTRNYLNIKNTALKKIIFKSLQKIPALLNLLF